MKAHLLTAACCLLSFCSTAQTIYWSEDFAGGPGEWTIQTARCDGTLTPFTGTWTLTAATQAGTPIGNLNATLSFDTENEYAVSFRKDEVTIGCVQSQYAFNPAGQQLISFVDAPGLNLNGSSFQLNINQSVRWYGHLQISPEDFASWGRTLTGVADPTLLLTDEGLTLLDPDSQTEFSFGRTNPCGRLWWWHPTGNVRPALSVTNNLTIASPTAGNGAMMLNADFLTTRDDPSSVPLPSYPLYQSELISPVIDLSEVSEKLSLRFHQLVRFANPAPEAPLDDSGRPLRTALHYSTDGGQHWSEPIALNPFLLPAVGINPPLPVNNVVTLPLPAELSGQPAVRLKFTWSGDLFFWVIDDLTILSRPLYDLEIKRDFAALTPNAVTPRSQLEPVPFVADIRNNGAAPATNVQLELAIERIADQSVVFSNTLSFGTLTSDSLAENQPFSQDFDPDGLPQGQYRGRYLLTQDSTDSFAEDNELTWLFELSDTTFAKDRGFTTSLTPLQSADFIYGNAYYVPQGEGWYARYLSFAVANAQQLAGLTVTTLLYEWSGDANGDFLANPTEYGQAPIAVNQYQFSGEEGPGLITLPVSSTNAGVPLADGNHYLVTIRFDSPDGRRLFPLFTTDYPHQASWYLSDLNGAPRYAGLLALGSDLSPDFNMVGFGFDIIPLVHLHIGDNPNLEEAAVGTKDKDNRLPVVAVYPNPSTGNFRVTAHGFGTAPVELTLRNAAGQPVLHLTEPLSRSLELSAPSAGLYFLELRNRQARAVRKVMIMD